ncbi:hypothetical protein P43SY_000568 [Pythium insidiosum]|uniref:Uncharacterized protein n=1 Tax=Pythium insidiosum TaxID=114742 RepID=A0AAD5M2V7_PYTIN|nr:hypothetical protein P43SY_000568 [Pythium insidiosum]
MLGLKYVMAKGMELTSKGMELTSKLELGAVVGVGTSASHPTDGSAAPPPPPPPPVATAPATAAAPLEPSPHSEGEAFIAAQHEQWERVLSRHRRLLESGERLSAELQAARRRLQDQVESEAYVAQHFGEIAGVREQLARMRGLVEKIADDVEDVERFLLQQTEEHMAAQNASFVAQQEQELERFEAQILDEKEERHRVLLEARRQVLADAFEKDLKTYRTLVSYQGTTLAQRAMTPEPNETLESIDLVVPTDATTLEAFYDSEEEPAAEEKEEEKQEVKQEPKQETEAQEEDV